MAKTPEQYRECLLTDLTKRQPITARFERYYDGDHDLPVVQEKLKQQQRIKQRWSEFLRLLKLSRANWCELVVEAVVQRLKVVGFRQGFDPARKPAAGEDVTKQDDVAWGIWQANHLDANQKLVYRDAGASGFGYVLVWPSTANQSKVAITVEHHSQCIIERDVETGEIVAGLKTWVIDKTQYVTLYLPTEVYKWESPVANTRTSTKVAWKPREVEGEAWPLPNPMGRVCLFECKPRPRTLGLGRSELDGLIDIQDRINFTLFGRVLAAWYTSVRQRWATGLTVEVDDETKVPKSPFEAAIDTLWVATDKDAKFGEFEAIDLKPFIDAVESDIAMMAGIAQMPPQYLLSGIGKASGESLKVSESSLIAKVLDRRSFVEEFWEEVIRCALIAAGKQGGDTVNSEVEWADPEHRTEGELVDALVKMRGLEVPLEVLWRRWGASPQEVDRWKAINIAEALTAKLSTPAPVQLVTTPASPPSVDDDDLEDA